MISYAPTRKLFKSTLAAQQLYALGAPDGNGSDLGGSLVLFRLSSVLGMDAVSEMAKRVIVLKNTSQQLHALFFTRSLSNKSMTWSNDGLL